MKNLIFIFLLLGAALPNSELLRSKYLSEDMILNIEKLDQYNKKARLIFNKYEKAKFYQIVAYTYYLKYQDLTEELNSLERQYFSIIRSYNPNFNTSLFYDIPSPKMKNAFSPILFSEESEIKIRLFKSKAGLFEKQYHEYLDYFNLKIRALKKILEESKKNKTEEPVNIQHNVKYDTYSDLILGIESKNELLSNINSIIENDLVSEINWYEDELYCKKDFFYSKNNNLYKIIDYKDGLKENETIYNVEDDFIDYIIGNKLAKNINSNDNYAISYYNKFGKIYKKVYFSISGEIIGSILFKFKENLELVSEIWYIGDNRTKIREFRQIYDPKIQKYITADDRVIKELR